MKRFGLLFFLFHAVLMAQQIPVTGKIVDPSGNAITNVQIFLEKKPQKGTVSGQAGKFELKLNPGNYTLIFKHLAYQTYKKNIRVEKPVHLEIVLKPKIEEIPGISIVTQGEKENKGAVRIEKKILEIVPVLSNGVKNVLITLPSVTQLDELSSQYLVRGGNYDENAVFINGIEVYRPFLARSGRQEGLGIINSDLIENLHFYAGAFPADLGDKLSSVLDIRYVKPQTNSYHADMGFTGGNFSVFHGNGKIHWLGGIRYLNNFLFLTTPSEQAEYRPAFADIQTLTSYEMPGKIQWEWLNYLSFNYFSFLPHTKQTNFGTFTDARTLVIHYDGQEKDRFLSQFSALKTTYKPASGKKIIWINSFYHSGESEYFDILASYFIGEPNTDLSGNDFGEPENLKALGQQLDHARNDLDAYILKTLLKYRNKQSPSVKWEAGVSFHYENIRDRLREYQIIDSAGFSILPPHSEFHPEEPYVSDTLPIVPFESVRSDYLTAIQRVKGYYTIDFKYENDLIKGKINPGIRFNYWHIHEFINGLQHESFTYSPRFLITARPVNNLHHLFRFTAGLYMQPPAYREFRNPAGEINVKVKAQKAWNFSLSHEWQFHWKDFPLKLNSEIYYRYLFDVNPYRIENIRIRYAAQNNALAYAYGAEVMLYAELLPGTPSWLSLSYSKSLENIEGRGYIPRPTDQRFKMNLLFQDYVPNLPFLKMFLNNIFATGMPTGAPRYADPYDFQFRTRNYWRTDIGLYYDLTANPKLKKIRSKFKNLNAGLEIINIFDRRNSVSNLWVREIYSKRMMGIPNYLTGRIFNVKVKVSW